MSGLLGKKVRMTQIFTENGEVAPVTIINAGPCYITQVKSSATDGYDAIQIGYSEAKEKHLTKAELGHLKKNKIKPQKYLREIRLPYISEMKVGDELKVDIFSEGEEVIISGKSKGKGFQGAMKRHGFSGANKTHGQSDRWRAPGSLGQSSSPSRVYKGTAMAGRMGNHRVTISSARIVRIDSERNLLFVRGSVPGATNSLLEIKKR